MNDAAPITWLINEITKIVESGAAEAATAVASAVTPVVSVCFGIYIILICVNYMRGSETEPVIDFGMRIAAFAVVIGLGLNAANYTGLIIPLVTGLGGDLANAISGGNVTADTLDQLALHYFSILEQGYTLANSAIFPLNVGPLILYFIKAICILVGLIPFLAAATLVVIVANVGSIIVAMLGPLYFAFLLFPATRQYFSAWINTAFSYALIPVITAVIAIVSVGLSKEMFSGAADFDRFTLRAVFLASLGNLTLLFLLKQVGSLASSLSAGGINAAMPGGIGAAASAMRNGAYGSARDMKAIGKAASGTYRGAKAVGTAISNRLNSIRKAG